MNELLLPDRCLVDGKFHKCFLLFCNDFDLKFTFVEKKGRIVVFQT